MQYELGVKIPRPPLTSSLGMCPRMSAIMFKGRVPMRFPTSVPVAPREPQRGTFFFPRASRTPSGPRRIFFPHVCQLLEVSEFVPGKPMSGVRPGILAPVVKKSTCTLYSNSWPPVPSSRVLMLPSFPRLQSIHFSVNVLRFARVLWLDLLEMPSSYLPVPYENLSKRLSPESLL